MNDDQLAALHDVIQFCLFGVIDTSGQSRADFVAAVKGGQAVESIISGWLGNPAHAAWAAQLAALRALPVPLLTAICDAYKGGAAAQAALAKAAGL